MKARPRNQRLSRTKVRKQQHLLEVTVRRDTAKAMRQRAVAAFICKSLLFLALTVGGWIGGKELLRRFLWENPDYFLTDLRVTPTDGALTREQILHAAGISEGRNIFTLNLTEARAELDKLPQVERAEIQRVLPNRIDITITERRPIAWVTALASDDPTSSDRALLIDARGVVMRSKRTLPEYYHLPVISGVPVGNFTPGQRVNTFEMQAALELVRLNVDNTRWQALNIDLAKGYCLVVTDRNRAKITFGLDRIDLQLERLFRHLEYIEPTKKEIQTINLMVERNTPVTFVEPPPPPLPPPPESPAPARFSAPLPAPRAIPVAKPEPAAKPPSSGRKSMPDNVRKPFRMQN